MSLSRRLSAAVSNAYRYQQTGDLRPASPESGSSTRQSIGLGRRAPGTPELPVWRPPAGRTSPSPTDASRPQVPSRRRPIDRRGTDDREQPDQGPVGRRPGRTLRTALAATAEQPIENDTQPCAGRRPQFATSRPVTQPFAIVRQDDV